MSKSRKRIVVIALALFVILGALALGMGIGKLAKDKPAKPATPALVSTQPSAPTTQPPSAPAEQSQSTAPAVQPSESQAAPAVETPKSTQAAAVIPSGYVGTWADATTKLVIRADGTATYTVTKDTCGYDNQCIIVFDMSLSIDTSVYTETDSPALVGHTSNVRQMTRAGVVMNECNLVCQRMRSSANENVHISWYSHMQGSALAVTSDGSSNEGNLLPMNRVN